MHKAPATFDLKKINALNRKWLKHKYKHNLDEFKKVLQPTALSDGQLQLLADMSLDRINKIKDIKEQFSYLFN